MPAYCACPYNSPNKQYVMIDMLLVILLANISLLSLTLIWGYNMETVHMLIRKLKQDVLWNNNNKTITTSESRLMKDSHIVKWIALRRMLIMSLRVWFEGYLTLARMQSYLHNIINAVKGYLHSWVAPENYRIAGNFHWCKFSYIWPKGPQNKCSCFNFVY